MRLAAELAFEFSLLTREFKARQEGHDAKDILDANELIRVIRSVVMARGEEIESFDDGFLSVRRPDGATTSYNLGSLARHAALVDRSEWPAVVENFTGAFSEILEATPLDDLEFAAIASRLRVVIASTDDVSSPERFGSQADRRSGRRSDRHSVGRSGQSSAHKPNMSSVPRLDRAGDSDPDTWADYDDRAESDPTVDFDPYDQVQRVVAPGLLEILALDYPSAVRRLLVGDTVKWGRSAAELLDIGRANVRRDLEDRWDPVGDGSDGIEARIATADEEYAAQQMLVCHESGKGSPLGTLFAVPTSYITLRLEITERLTAENIMDMVSMSQGLYTNNPGPIRPELYLSRDGQLTRIPTTVLRSGDGQVTPVVILPPEVAELISRSGPAAA